MLYACRLLIEDEAINKSYIIIDSKLKFQCYIQHCNYTFVLYLGSTVISKSIIIIQ